MFNNRTQNNTKRGAKKPQNDQNFTEKNKLVNDMIKKNVAEIYYRQKKGPKHDTKFLKQQQRDIKLPNL